MLLYNSRSRCRCCCLWPFCFLDLEHYSDPVLFFPPLCLRLGLLRQEARVRRAFLLSVLFADVLLLRLGVTRTSRAVLIIVLFADVLFLLLLPARN